MRREPDEARRCLRKGIALSKEFGLPLVISEGRFQLGWALAEEGHVEEGIREMREGLAAITATGAEVGLPHYLCVLAQCLRRVW